MITRKEMQRLADGVKYVADDPTADHSTVVKTVQEIGNALTALNERFKRELWVAAVFGPARKVRNSWDHTQFITCRGCGYDHFYDRGRSLDTFNWECGRCGHMNHTMTETGMSA